MVHGAVIIIIISTLVSVLCLPLPSLHVLDFYETFYYLSVLLWHDISILLYIHHTVMTGVPFKINTATWLCCLEKWPSLCSDDYFHDLVGWIDLLLSCSKPAKQDGRNFRWLVKCGINTLYNATVVHMEICYHIGNLYVIRWNYYPKWFAFL